LSTEAFQRVAALVLQVELPTTLAMASNPDPAVGEGTRSLDLKAAKSLSEAVAATW
jgi:hypothetical protein